MTNEEHNKYIAWAFVGHGAFQAFILLVMAAIFSIVLFIPDRPGQPGPPAALFGMILGLVAVINLLFVVPSFVAAYALFKRKSWARVASIIAGVLSAMNVPFGTLACVYSLWFFLGENWKTIYEPSGSARLITEPTDRWEPYYQNDRGETVFRNVDPPDWR